MSSNKEIKHLFTSTINPKIGGNKTTCPASSSSLDFYPQGGQNKDRQGHSLEAKPPPGGPVPGGPMPVAPSEA